MPTADTFDCVPIGDLVRRYLKLSSISVDPFARNKRWATYTNDLNPNTAAEYHLDALDFLHLMSKEGVMADLVIIDPPYSFNQMKECYQGVGREISPRESTNFYGDLRDAVMPILMPCATVISCGWNSIGMGKKRGFEIIEILLVCHGRAHNDTIVTVDELRAPRMI